MHARWAGVLAGKWAMPCRVKPSRQAEAHASCGADQLQHNANSAIANCHPIYAQPSGSSPPRRLIWRTVMAGLDHWRCSELCRHREQKRGSCSSQVLAGRPQGNGPAGMTGNTRISCCGKLPSNFHHAHCTTCASFHCAALQCHGKCYTGPHLPGSRASRAAEMAHGMDTPIVCCPLEKLTWGMGDERGGVRAAAAA